MVGGGGTISMERLTSLAQLQTNSVARLQREADVSKLKAQRAKSDKDGEQAGIHTQMEIPEEALYSLGECDRLVGQCTDGEEGARKVYTPMHESPVEKIHGRLKAVDTVLRRRL